MNEFEAKIELVDPVSIRPYQRNTKKHPADQVKKILNQILTFGFDQPIVVDKDSIIIKGHGRHQAALSGGLKRVPIIRANHLTEEQVRAARIADNKVAESEWDEDFLKFELGSLQMTDLDLNLTGFELPEIEKLLSAGDLPEDKAPSEVDAATQFIVTVHCLNEVSMQEVFEELKGRGFSCKLVT